MRVGTRQEVVILRRLYAPHQVHRVGAKVERRQVPVAHFDGTLLEAVIEHGSQRELGGLDGLDDVEAAAPAEGIGIGLPPLFGNSSRPDQFSRLVQRADELGLRGLAHGPPGDGTEGRETLFEISPNERAVARFRERVVKPA